MAVILMLVSLHSVKVVRNKHLTMYVVIMCILAAVPPSRSSGDDPQQDGGDVGPSVIEHLPVGVSVQCKLIQLVCK